MPCEKIVIQESGLLGKLTEILGNYMKDQAEAIKGQLEEIEPRMRDLEAEK